MDTTIIAALIGALATVVAAIIGIKYNPKSKSNPSKSEKCLITNKSTTELYNILMTEFDRVTFMISDILKIRCTTDFWKKALKQFLTNYDNSCPQLTENNLPYVFAYVGLQNCDIFGQSFLANSELYNALKENSNVVFKPNSKMSDKKYTYEMLTKKDHFLGLQFRFSNYSYNIENRFLKETMMFYVDDLNTNSVIYEKEINFNQRHFNNLIKSTDASKRSKTILKIAKEQMTDIHTNDN